ncbi:hypothetical protein L3X38_012377 [Prunus dulcis]|uniref:Uncharacterized protein n=1 Tax=Prunus dulcis TaxID=3755 RepID=A0AAD4ZFY9_PRUDU|nr:hypothetical protein L3X38_012377 [Prunus dulcis]
MPLRRARRNEFIDTRCLPKTGRCLPEIAGAASEHPWHGTGGVGIVVESPTFFDRSPIRRLPVLAGNGERTTGTHRKSPKLQGLRSPSSGHHFR